MNTYCPSCDNPVDADASKCPKCGAIFGEGSWQPVARAEAPKPPVVVDPAEGRTLRYTGYGLIVLALALPIMMVDTTGLYVRASSRLAGGVIGGVLIAWAVLALIARFATRNSNGHGKGRAGLIVGVVLLLMSVANTLQIIEQKRAMESAAQELKAAVAGLKTGEPAGQVPTPPGSDRGEAGMIRAMATMMREMSAEGAALNRKFEAAELSDVVTGPSLVSPASIARSREKLKRYEALITERADLFNRLMVRSENIILQSELGNADRAAALKGYYAKKAVTEPAFRELDRTSRAIVATARAVLDFAERNPGEMSFKQDRLMFKKQAPMNEYAALMQRLNADSRSESAAQEKFAAVQRESSNNLNAFVTNISK